MSFVSRVAHFWRHLVHRDAANRELHDEVQAFVELLTEEKIRNGLGAAEARRIALMETGGIAQVHDTAQQSRSGAGLERLTNDVRHAFRMLRRSPGFTVAAVIVLALGIGASTTVLSVVRGVLLRPFAYAHPSELVVILEGGRNPIAPANFLDLKNDNHSFSGVGAAEFWTPALVVEGSAEKIYALHQTADVLSLLGIPPALGRIWNGDNDLAGNDHVAVISDGLWRRRFNGDRSVIGRRVLLDGESYEVVGVMPPTFAFAPFWATKAELWAPLSLADRATSRDGSSLRVFARLAPGITIQRAELDVVAITARIEREFPGTAAGISVAPLADRVVGNVRTPLLLMLGAVAFVLLMSCTNVAHMMLARATVREREMTVRAALGASRGRLVRQTLTESVVLAAIAGTLGIVLALVGVHTIATLGVGSIPRVSSVSLDAFSLIGAVAVTISCGIVFGVAPALRSARSDMSISLHSGGRTIAGGWESARRVLIGSQFALAVVLLVGAGLMIRSVVALQSIDPGFNSEGVVSAIMTTTGTAQAAPGRREGFYLDVVRQLNALPSVASASAINHAPLTGDVWGLPFRIEGQPAPAKRADTPSATYRVVLPAYFRTMGIHILQGRDFSGADRRDAPGVAIINQRLAEKYWPGENALGRRVAFTGRDSTLVWRTVVGITANTVRDEWSAPAEPEVFLPLLQENNFLESPQSHFAEFTLVVKARCGEVPRCDANTIVPAIRRVLASADASVPLSDIIRLDDAVANATAEPRFYLALLSGFASVALVLAVVGIYGVMSYAVVQRTREMGVRLALGATPNEVLMQVLREGVLLASSGAAVGVIAGLLLSRLMTSVLFGVAPTDPATFTAVVCVLLLAATAAVLVPARRATAIDPLVALRGE